MKRMTLGKMAAAVACCRAWWCRRRRWQPNRWPSIASAPGAMDVALRPGGMLVGQVVDPQGARPGRSSWCRFNTPTMKSFAPRPMQTACLPPRGLRGGQYQILTDDGISVCRLWAPDTAPPAARPAALWFPATTWFADSGVTPPARCTNGSVG